MRPGTAQLGSARLAGVHGGSRPPLPGLAQGGRSGRCLFAQEVLGGAGWGPQHPGGQGIESGTPFPSCSLGAPGGPSCAGSSLGRPASFQSPLAPAPCSPRQARGPQARVGGREPGQSPMAAAPWTQDLLLSPPPPPQKQSQGLFFPVDAHSRPCAERPGCPACAGSAAWGPEPLGGGRVLHPGPPGRPSLALILGVGSGPPGCLLVGLGTASLAQTGVLRAQAGTAPGQPALVPWAAWTAAQGGPSGESLDLWCLHLCPSQSCFLSDTKGGREERRRLAPGSLGSGPRVCPRSPLS